MEDIKYLKMEIGDKYIEYKDFLTEAEYAAIVKLGLETYVLGIDSKEGRIEDDIECFRFNPIAMERNFYRNLCLFCVKDLNEDLFGDIFDKGAHKQLKKDILNADDAYNLLMKSADKLGGLENILDVNMKLLIDKIGDKIPEKGAFEGLLKMIPKELAKLNIRKDE